MAEGKVSRGGGADKVQRLEMERRRLESYAKRREPRTVPFFQTSGFPAGRDDVKGF